MTAVMRIASGKILTVSTGQQPQLYLTTDAGKPSPGVGDIAICYDTGKNYTCYVNGVWTLIYSPTVERYSNHLGTVDNVMTTSVIGDGTANTDASTHTMQIDGGSGMSNAGYASVFGIRPDITDFVFNLKITSIANGAGAAALTAIGLFTGYSDYTDSVIFRQKNNHSWVTYTASGASSQETAITALAAGDIVTIVGHKTKVDFFVNGSLVATHTQFITGNVIKFGAAVTIDPGASGRRIYVDMVSIEVMK